MLRITLIGKCLVSNPRPQDCTHYKRELKINKYLYLCIFINNTSLRTNDS